MQRFPKPIVVVSRCLGFAACRYNGDILSSDAVNQLKPYIEVRTPCPEVQIGLGVPRDPIRLALVGGDVHLIQPSTQRDLSEPMRRYAAEYLSSLDAVDGFVLKSRSPSCGMKDVRLYANKSETAMPSGKTNGYFGGAVLARFPNTPTEDEGRLRNFTIRERFLMAIFTLAAYRQSKEHRSMAKLVQFHTANKYLLMSFQPHMCQRMGQVVANHSKLPLENVLTDYEVLLHQILKQTPSPGSVANVLLHEFGHISSKLTPEERQFFLATLDEYRAGQLPLSACARLLQSLVVRFQDEYLMQQTFFQPFPPELISISDSGKGRD